jgi:hypothetical protein
MYRTGTYDKWYHGTVRTVTNKQQNLRQKNQGFSGILKSSGEKRGNSLVRIGVSGFVSERYGSVTLDTILLICSKKLPRYQCCGF